MEISNCEKKRFQRFVNSLEPKIQVFLNEALKKEFECYTPVKDKYDRIIRLEIPIEILYIQQLLYKRISERNKSECIISISLPMRF